MVALAHAWHKTNNLLRQSRREIENLSTNIAIAKTKIRDKSIYAYLYAQNLAAYNQDLEKVIAIVHRLEAQTRELEQKYRDAGYDQVEYSTWTPGETLISGRGIEEVGRAIDAGGLAGRADTDGRRNRPGPGRGLRIPTRKSSARQSTGQGFE